MLSATAARQAPAKDKPYRLSDEKGLYLEIHPTGSKYWRFKYRFGGKEKRLALGVFPDVPLKEARDRRDEARKLLRDGLDPSQERRRLRAMARQQTEDSFGAIGREWLAKERRHWSESHLERVERALTKDLAALSTRPIRDITSPELLSALRRVEARGAIETAHRTKQVAGQIFRYAVAIGRADSDPSRDLKGALVRPKKTHLAAITDPHAVGELLRAIDGYQGTPVVRAALRLAPLVFVRPGELRTMEWREIVWASEAWHIPPEKMKTGREHIVPLSRQALEILLEVQPLTGRFRYVFPSARSPRRPMSNNAVLSAFRRMDIPNDMMSGHGFRAMARTLLDEVLEFRVDIIEHQLAHAVRDVNGEAYNRTKFLKQRRSMMQRWSDYLDELKQDGGGRVARETATSAGALSG